MHTSQKLFHIQIHSLQILAASEIVSFTEKIGRNGCGDNRDLQENKNECIRLQLPQVIPKPFCIIYHCKSKLTTFKFPQHITVQNLPTIKYLAGVLQGRSGKSEDEKRALALLISFINEHSTVPSLKKNDQQDRRDKDNKDKKDNKGGDVSVSHKDDKSKKDDKGGESSSKKNDPKDSQGEEILKKGCQTASQVQGL